MKERLQKKEKYQLTKSNLGQLSVKKHRLAPMSQFYLE